MQEVDWGLDAEWIVSSAAHLTGDRIEVQVPAARFAAGKRVDLIMLGLEASKHRESARFELRCSIQEERIGFEFV